jgi:hypothetical protein
MELPGAPIDTRTDFDDLCPPSLPLQLFEIHHVDIERARRCLSRYHAGRCARPGPDAFSFDEGGFYATLRRRAKEVTVGPWMLVWATGVLPE